MEKARPEAGQAVVLLLLGLSIFLFGATALAINGSNLYAHWQMAQSAADAAAQAGVLSVFHGTNVTGANPFATATPATSFQCSTSDGRTPCVYARLNGFGGTAADTVTVAFPTSVAGVTKLSSNPVPAVSVTIRRSVSALLGGLGPATANVGVTAIAALLQAPIPNCINTLDTAASGALSLTGNVSLNIASCGIAVASNSSSAMSATGNITVTADSIQLEGGVSRAGNVSITPSPTTNLPSGSVTDPLASVSPPSFNATAPCDFTGLSYSGNTSVSLSPHTYCGGISLIGNSHLTFTAGDYILRGGLSVTGNASVTFGAGTYVLQGGGFTATGNVTLTGSGVTFYNTFDATHAYSPIAMTGNLNASLSAPTSGALQGMLFFQDRNAPAGSTESFTGNTNQTFTGAIYFPKSTLSYTGNSSSSPQNVVIVADKLTLVGNANITYDPTQAAAAHQVSVALVQ